ncbi:MAG TPA: hypothetical protein VGE07_04360 [Herpetosiphonaceae bacterium]
MTAIESYFTGLGTDDIRLVGHRVGLDDVVLRHLHGARAEDIQSQLDTLSLAEIYACLFYYYANQPAVDAYLERVATWRAQRIAEATTTPSAFKQKLLDARQAREAQR